jgi:Xaa-Pro aminopeptidase
MELPFPLEEYENRMNRLKAGMEKEGLDALLVHGMPGRSGQLRYVANFNSFLGNTLVVIPQSGDPALITETVFHGEPMHAMIFTTWVKDVRWTDHPAATKVEDFVREVKDVFVEKGLERANLGIVGDRWIPASLKNSLLEAFPEARFSSAIEMYQNVTAIKSPLEIELMRQAVAIAGRGLDAGYQAVRPGVEEFEVSAEIRYAMAKAGAEETWDPLAAVAGPKSGYKHCSPSNRPIQDGDMVFIDISPVYKGYIVDVARTWVLGNGSPEAIKMLDTALLMSDEAVKAIRPGVTGKEVMSLCEKLAKDVGLFDYFYPVGHGTGSTKFEKPILAEHSLDVVLEAGMVFSLEPMLVKEELGTGVVEDTVLVTETGAEILPCFKRKLW